MCPETYTFMLQLRSCNYFWYLSVVNCARQNPRSLKKCLADACRTINYMSLDAKHVNLFEVIKSANSGILSNDDFGKCTSDAVWHLYRATHIEKVRKEFNP